jgi:stage III sporulation protein AA
LGTDNIYLDKGVGTMISLNLENLLMNQFGKDFDNLLKEDVEEIRLRINKPICIKKGGREYFLDRQRGCTENIRTAVKCSEDDIKKLINHICQYSMYAYEEEIRQGFISIPGGHRVGISGQVVLDEHRKIKTIKYVNGLNIRISHQIKDAANLSQLLKIWLLKVALYFRIT